MITARATVRTLATRKWSLSAITLAIGAIVALIVCKHHAGKAAVSMARAAADGSSKRVLPFALLSARRSDQWGGISLGLVLLAVICWGFSRGAGESRSPLLLIILLSVYLILFMLMV